MNGNKDELNELYNISFFILQLANQHSIRFFETSAWKDINVTEAFTGIAEQVLDKVGVALDNM